MLLNDPGERAEKEVLGCFLVVWQKMQLKSVPMY